MAKRPTVDVDEEYLKEIMAGGVVSQRKEQMKQVAEQPKQEVEESPLKEEPETVPTSETKEPVKQVRKKREALDYESVFLERKASVARSQIYISTELYETITGFLPVIAGRQFNITSFVNNILTHHLDFYKDDINGLYEKKTKKPL